MQATATEIGEKSKTVTLEPNQDREWYWDGVEAGLKLVGESIQKAKEEELGEETGRLLGWSIEALAKAGKTVRLARLKAWSARLPEVDDGLPGIEEALLEAAEALESAHNTVDILCRARKDLGKESPKLWEILPPLGETKRLISYLPK